MAGSKVVKRAWEWIKNHPKTVIATIVFGLLLTLNASAYMHARAMTHFVQRGTKTSKPESLGVLGKIVVMASGVKIPKPKNRKTPKHVDLPFTVHLYSGTAGFELEGWHISHPKPKGVCLFFHGYAGKKSGLLKEAQAIHKQGYDCFLIDFRGSGGSSGNTTSIGYHEAQDVVASIEYVGKRISSQHPILFGQSMGSAAILRAVGVLGASPKALILETPFDRLLTTTRNRFALMGIPAFPCAELLLFWGGVQLDYSAFSHNPIDYAQGVRCPVLLMNGKKDKLAKISEVRAVYENLRGEKTFVVFDQAIHGALRKQNPLKWEEAVGNFLTP